MDKNIAAILREDARTIEVRYTTGRMYGNKSEDANATFIYVTDIADLKEGDLVVVPCQKHFSVAEVVEMHDDLRIQPNDEIEYRWVVQKVDAARYYKTLEQNRELQGVVGKAYQQNIRRSFAQSVLANLSDSDKAAVAGLLGA